MKDETWLKKEQISTYDIRDAITTLLKEVREQEILPENVPEAFREDYVGWTTFKLKASDETLSATLQKAYDYFKANGVDIPDLQPQSHFGRYLVQNVHETLMPFFMKNFMQFFVRVAHLGSTDRMHTAFKAFPPPPGFRACFDGTSERLYDVLSSLSLNGRPADALEWFSGFLKEMSVRLTPTYVAIGNQIHISPALKLLFKVDSRKNIERIDGRYPSALHALSLSAAYAVRERFIEGFRTFLVKDVQESIALIAECNLQLEQTEQELETYMEDPGTPQSVYDTLKEKRGKIETLFSKRFGFELSGVFDGNSRKIRQEEALLKAYRYIHTAFISSKMAMAPLSLKEVLSPEVVAKLVLEEDTHKREEGLMALVLLSEDLKGKSPAQLFRALQLLSKSGGIAAGLALLKDKLQLETTTGNEKEILQYIIDKTEFYLSNDPTVAPFKEMAEAIEGKKKSTVLDLLLSGAPRDEIRSVFQASSDDEKAAFYNALVVAPPAIRNYMRIAEQFVFHTDAENLVGDIKIHSAPPIFLHALSAIAVGQRRFSLINRLIEDHQNNHFFYTLILQQSPTSFFHFAYQQNFKECIPLMLKGFAALPATMQKKLLETPYLPQAMSLLQLAVDRGDLEAAQLFLEKGANVNQAVGSTLPPLCIAVLKGNTEMASLLIKHGANVHLRTKEGQTLLHFAARQNNSTMAELLLKAGASVDQEDQGYHTPLMDAVVCNAASVIKILLKNGAIPCRKDNFLTSPFYYALANNRVEAVELMLDYMSVKDPNIDNRGNSLLHVAVRENVIDIIELLLKKGADINQPNSDEENEEEYGQTPLHCAAGRGHEEVAELLLRNGAHVNALDNAGDSPLHCAIAEEVDIEMLRLLLKKGADIELVNNNGETPLISAINYGNSQIVEFLLKKGAKVNQVVQNMTPLHRAIDGALEEEVALLIKWGANVNPLDSTVVPPLFSAMSFPYRWGTVPLLLQAGADVAAVTDYAKKHMPNETLADILEKLEMFRSMAEKIVDTAMTEGGKRLFPDKPLTFGEKVKNTKRPLAIATLQKHLMIQFAFDTKAMEAELSGEKGDSLGKELSLAIAAAKSGQEGKITLKQESFVSLIQAKSNVAMHGGAVFT